jgi:hypothetical protein
MNCPTWFLLAGGVIRLSRIELLKSGGPRVSIPFDVVEATEVSIAAGDFGPLDYGAVAALRALALKISEGNANDNVSISAYLKYCDQLGLSPAGRKALDIKKERAGGKLSAIRGGKSA